MLRFASLLLLLVGAASADNEDEGPISSPFADFQPMDFSYIGCFAEHKQFHAVPYLAKKSPFMTIQMCGFHCRSKGMQVFAMTDFNKCRCSDGPTYKKYGAVSETMCNTVCEGGDGVCGGLDAISVYELADVPEATDLDFKEVQEIIAARSNSTIEDQTQIHENDPRAAGSHGIIAEGDMVVPLPAVAELLQLSENANLTSMLQQPSHHADFLQVRRGARAFLNGRTPLWENGRVRYFYESINSKFQGYADRAIKALESRTCLKFEQSRTNAIRFTGNQAGCFAYVGYVAPYLDGTQQINLGPRGCDDYGVVAHEIGHALGMHHEHSRPDRDKFIKVYPSRFTDPSQFEITANADTSVPYDIGSLMHYNPKIFTTGGDTMEPKVAMPAGQRCCGTYAGFTDADFQQLNNMYCGGKSKGGPSPSPRRAPSPSPRPSSSPRRRSPRPSSPRRRSPRRRSPPSRRPSPAPVPTSTGKCCYEACGSHGDCNGGLFCCPFHRKCMDRTTKSTQGPNCNACRSGGRSQPSPRPAPSPAPSGGKKCCYEACGGHGDCGSNLFCCPYHRKCMDRQTKSTQGPNCNACRSGGGGSPRPAPSPSPKGGARRRRSSRSRRSRRSRRSKRRRSLLQNTTSVALLGIRDHAERLAIHLSDLATLVCNGGACASEGFESTDLDNGTQALLQSDGPRVEKDLSGSCDMEDSSVRKMCKRKEKSVVSDVDSSVRVADPDDDEITVDVASSSTVDSTGYVYVQFTSDKLRSPDDKVVVLPAHAKDDEEAALRQALVPPINPLNRRADTGGLFALPINPDLPPDAQRRVEVPPVPLGKYKLVYVRALVKEASRKYISSDVFEVVASSPSQPGQVMVEKGEDGTSSLSWAAPLFAGGHEKPKFKLEYCEKPAGECMEWTAYGKVDDTRTVVGADKVPAGSHWRAVAFNSIGESQPGW